MYIKRIKPVLLALILLSSLFVGCAKKQGLGADEVARVNGRPIARATLNVRMKIYELFFRQPMDNPSSKQQLLDQLVQDALIREQADKLGVSVTDAQVEAELAKFLGALDRQYQSRDEVNKKLQELQLTNDDIAGFLKDFLLSQAVVAKKQAEATVADDELKAYYEQNRERVYTYKENVVRAAHVLVPLDQEAKAREIAAKAKAGGDFAELAKLYSVDPGSAQSGGDLGYFAQDTMVKEFSDAAFSMVSGEVSEPVKSQFGWHIIKLLDKQGPGTLTFEQAKDHARSQLLAEKQAKLVEEWTKSLVQNAKIEKADLTK